MKKLILPVAFVFLTLFSVIGLAEIETQYLSKGPIVVENITVIDGLGHAPAHNRDIVIVEGKISSISKTGESEHPENATVVDGKGLTAMPGLIDMHYHLKGGWTGGNTLQDKYPPSELLTDSAVQQSLAAMLYAGVTTAFDMGSTHGWIVNQRDRINGGELIGPRYFISGVPFSQEPTGWDAAVRGESTDEPEADALSTKIDTQDLEVLGNRLDRYHEDGISLIKLYSGTSALAASFLIKEANRRNIRTVADLWQLNMDADWMRMTGLDGWAHASPYPIGEDALKWMADNDKFVIATMVIGEAMAGLRVKDDGANQSFFDNPLILDIWGREVIEDFYASYPFVRENLYEGDHSFYQTFNFGDLSKFRDEFLKNIKNAHDAGVLVAGGTDSPAYPTLWSGESMHRELELFVMAGISPIDAIKMCSFNGARILEKEKEFGSIQPGLAADIMIVEGEPWKNISDTRNIRHVIVRGGMLDRQKILTSWQ